MELQSVVTKEHSYSFPCSTTLPEQVKFCLCFRPIWRSRYCLFSNTFPQTHCKAGSFVDLRCATFGADVEVSAVKVEATPACDLVFVCDGAVAMVVVVVLVVVTVIDNSRVVAVSVLAFLGEGSQPFSVGRDRFRECPVTIESSRGNGTSSVISISALPNLKLHVLPKLSAASKCSIILCSPFFKRDFLGTNSDNCISPSKAFATFLSIGWPFLMISATHCGKKGVK